MAKDSILEVREHPDLKEPRMIMAWPDTGHVGLRVIDYARQKLGARRFGRFRPQSFSLIPWVSVKDGVVENVRYMKNEFYYWKNPGGEHDLVLLKSEQPISRTFEYVTSVLDMAEKLQVKRIYMAGSFGATGLDHLESPMVLGVANDPALRAVMDEHDIKPYPEYKGVGNLQSTFQWFARKKGIDALSLWAPMPYYIARLPFPWSNYPKCAIAILEKLGLLEGLEIDMSDLKTLVRQTEMEMRKVYDELQDEARKESAFPSSRQMEQELPGGPPESISDEDMRRIMGDLEDFFKSEDPGL